jgi:hypothetical protein
MAVKNGVATCESWPTVTVVFSAAETAITLRAAKREDARVRHKNSHISV